MNERVLAGRYRVGEAVGGRSDLYHAEDVSLQRPVVVKRLGTPSAHNRGDWEQAIAKAASLHDPHLLSIYDVVMEEEELFLITEDMEGESLARFIRRQAPLEPEVALDLVRQVAGAVVQVERHGLEHVSIDPNAVLINRAGYVKIIHYGPLYTTQRQTSREHHGLLHVETLGILLYEMLTGHPHSDLVPKRHLLHEVNVKLSEARVSHDWLPRRLYAVTAKAFGIDESGTPYQTVQEMSKDLKALHHALAQPLVVEAGAVEQLDRPDVDHLPTREVVRDHGEAAEQDTLRMAPVAATPKEVAQPTKSAPLSPIAKLAQAAQAVEQNTARNRAVGRAGEGKLLKRAPLAYLWGVLVIVLVAGGLWWSVTDSTSATNSDSAAGVKEVKMPSLLNKTKEQAFQILTENGFPQELIQIVYQQAEEDGVSKGKVYRQSTDPNAPVLTNELIVLTINGRKVDAGTETAGEQSPDLAVGQVPDLTGLSLPQAEQTLLQLGYRYAYTIEQGSSPSGTVYKQEIAPGTAAAAGTQVKFNVSQ